jgi:hypothetical protein
LVTWLAKLQSTLRGLLSFIPKSGMTHVFIFSFPTPSSNASRTLYNDR